LENIVNIIEKDVDNKTFHLIYVSDLDTLQHKYGTKHELVKKKLFEINDLLEETSKKLENKKTRMIITADHGQIDVDKHFIFDKSNDDDNELLSYCDNVSGEQRVLFFKLKNKNYDKEFIKSFEKKFGDHFLLLTSKEVEELQLFGKSKMSDSIRERIGDYIAIALDNSLFSKKNYCAHHGGLTIEEIMIPLIIS
jgi:predicted AlkP superfamily pyrophosphatase or phosphodiesterase